MEKPPPESLVKVIGKVGGFFCSGKSSPDGKHVFRQKNTIIPKMIIFCFFGGEDSLNHPTISIWNCFNNPRVEKIFCIWVRIPT